MLRKNRPPLATRTPALVEGVAKAQNAACVVISCAIEQEISQLDGDEAAMFLDEMGLAEPGLNRLIRAGYDLLTLQTFFTVGPKEARAWTVARGVLAPQAAGVIHGILSVGLSVRKRLGMMIMSLARANRVLKRVAKCAPRVRGTPCATAMFCIFCLIRDFFGGGISAGFCCQVPADPAQILQKERELGFGFPTAMQQEPPEHCCYFATKLLGSITATPHRAKANIFRRPSILFRPRNPNFWVLVEPLGTAPRSDPLILCAFITIVP